MKGIPYVSLGRLGLRKWHVACSHVVSLTRVRQAMPLGQAGLQPQAALDSQHVKQITISSAATPADTFFSFFFLFSVFPSFLSCLFSSSHWLSSLRPHTSCCTLATSGSRPELHRTASLPRLPCLHKLFPPLASTRSHMSDNSPPRGATDRRDLATSALLPAAK